QRTRWPNRRLAPPRPARRRSVRRANRPDSQWFRADPDGPPAHAEPHRVHTLADSGSAAAFPVLWTAPCWCGSPVRETFAPLRPACPGPLCRRPVPLAVRAAPGPFARLLVTGRSAPYGPRRPVLALPPMSGERAATQIALATMLPS